MKQTCLTLALIATALSAQADPTLEKNGALTSKDGRSLYTFDKDGAARSNCNGACASAWPPFGVVNAALADANFTVIKRDDGGQQWAFRGMPLYFYAGDAKPGDRKGDKQGGVWHLFGSDGKQAATAGREYIYYDP